jgi:hypothetical protein
MKRATQLSHYRRKLFCGPKRKFVEAKERMISEHGAAAQK